MATRTANPPFQQSRAGVISPQTTLNAEMPAESIEQPSIGAFAGQISQQPTRPPESAVNGVVPFVRRQEVQPNTAPTFPVALGPETKPTLGANSNQPPALVNTSQIPAGEIQPAPSGFEGTTQPPQVPEMLPANNIVPFTRKETSISPENKLNNPHTKPPAPQQTRYNPELLRKESDISEGGEKVTLSALRGEFRGPNGPNAVEGILNKLLP